MLCFKTADATTDRKLPCHPEENSPPSEAERELSLIDHNFDKNSACVLQWNANYMHWQSVQVFSNQILGNFDS